MPHRHEGVGRQGTSLWGARAQGAPYFSSGLRCREVDRGLSCRRGARSWMNEDTAGCSPTGPSSGFGPCDRPPRLVARTRPSTACTTQAHTRATPQELRNETFAGWVATFFNINQHLIRQDGSLGVPKRSCEPVGHHGHGCSYTDPFSANNHSLKHVKSEA